MNSSPEQHTIAAEYTLGLLSSADAQAFEQKMLTDPDAEAAYIYWAEHFANLSDQWDESIPPEHIKNQLENYLKSQSNVTPLTKIDQKEKYRSPLWAMAAAVVLAVGIWFALPTQFEANYQTHLVSETTDLVIDVFVDVDDKQLRIEPLQGSASLEGDYELWVAIGDGAPMSLGVLDINNVQEISLDVSWLAGLSNAHMAISLEPKGGSPTGQPTGPVLAVADTMAL
ncbi:anti-sigma factor [Marinomonas atlantica]|uniref:anti-sigma factor n=1 Tax=Marinomonas atlantica TaxID=1806668 RepID=UPI00082BD751|nr:anti-sigma factor [Marinomonas atlantica]